MWYTGNECSTNNDSTWNIEWPSTPVGDTAFQKCPGLSESAGKYLKIVDFSICNYRQCSFTQGLTIYQYR